MSEMSVDLMTAPVKDEDQDRLECIKWVLNLERKKFTEAAVRLGKEKVVCILRYYFNWQS